MLKRMTSNMRRLSVAIVIVAAAILAYGLIDAQSYRAGYGAAYSRLSRAIDAACMRGYVLDKDLCADTEIALYGEDGEGDGIYAANAVVAILGPDVSGTPAKRHRYSRHAAKADGTDTAGVDAAAGGPAPAIAAVVVPIEPAVPPPPTRGQIAASFECAKITDPAKCDPNIVDPWCKWDALNADGSAVTTSRADGRACRDTALRISLASGDLDGICATRDVKDRLPGAYKYVGTDPITKQEVTVCIGTNAKFAYMMMPQGTILGEPVSTSEMLRVAALRVKGQSLGATSVAAPATMPPCPMPVAGQPMPTMPSGGCTPPNGMMTH